MASAKLDQKILKSNILRSRGYLLRKSMKHEKKWTYCFYYIDINKFVSERIKQIVSYRPLRKLIDRDISNTREFRRIKINENDYIFFVNFVLNGVKLYYCM